MTSKKVSIREPNDLVARIIGIPVTGIIGGLVSYNSGEDDSKWIYFLNSTFISFIIWQSNRWMVLRMRNWFPAFDQTVKRIAAQFTLGLGGSALVMVSYCYVFNYITFHRQPEAGIFLTSLVVGLSLTVFVSIIYECVYFFSMWKTSIVESEELKRQQLISQYETLKSQVNPHFLFNSLNTLAGLIEEKPHRAVDFVQELSKVYRHILNTRDKDTISLDEEMKFLQSYLFLLKMRFGDNLITEIHIEEHLKSKQLPTLALQQLVENAIKHNVIASGRELRLTITTDSSENLVVENNLQRKLSVEPSSGFGLESIRNRFHLLGSNAVRVSEDSHSFRVTIPLLQPS